MTQKECVGKGAKYSFQQFFALAMLSPNGGLGNPKRVTAKTRDRGHTRLAHYLFDCVFKYKTYGYILTNGNIKWAHNSPQYAQNSLVHWAVPKREKMSKRLMSFEGRSPLPGNPLRKRGSPLKTCQPFGHLLSF